MLVVLLQELTVFFLQIAVYLLNLWVYYNEQLISGNFKFRTINHLFTLSKRKSRNETYEKYGRLDFEMLNTVPAQGRSHKEAGGGAPPWRPLVGNSVLFMGFVGFDIYFWRILRRNDTQKHGSISVKK